MSLLALLLALGASAHPEPLSSVHAVIVSSSRYWFNYRHTANALSFYQLLRSRGVPDSQIVLMLADDQACDARNPLRGELPAGYPSQGAAEADDVHAGRVQVDYRGDEVSVDAVLRVLHDRHEPGTPTQKRLSSGARDNVLLFMTGHGGDGFLKFHDAEELTGVDLALGVRAMAAERRYREMVLLVDTCQAFTLCDEMGGVPGLLCGGSSVRDESSYSHHGDNLVANLLVDRFSHFATEYIRREKPQQSMKGLFEYLDPARLASTLACNSTLGRGLEHVELGHFFGGAQAAPAEAAERAAVPIELALSEEAEAAGAETSDRRPGGAVGGAVWDANAVELLGAEAVDAERVLHVQALLAAATILLGLLYR